MLQWKDEFAVGIEFIDEQHRHLIDIANQASELMDNDLITDKYDHIVAIIAELKDYTIYHFKSEEDYMAETNYKKRFSHMILHDDFIRKVEEVNFNDVDINQNDYIRGIINFVCDWLVTHIMKEDKLVNPANKAS